MKLKLRRETAAESTRLGADAASGDPCSLGTGTHLGRFIDSGIQIEVQIAGERRLWLQCRSGESITSIGPIVWDDYRTPSLNPVPDWLDANSWTTTVLVLKSTALHRAVMFGELLNPTLGIEVNPGLGDLVYQAETKF